MNSFRFRRAIFSAVAFLAVALLVAIPTARAQNLTTAEIMDPAFNVKAFTITIPAGWKFQGTVLPGTQCAEAPFPIFRAYSTDGLTEIRLLPIFGWSFHPNLNQKVANGCLDFAKTLTADEFLKYYEEMIATTGMRVVGPMPIVPSYQQRVEGVVANMNHYFPNAHNTATAAAVRIETVNGSFVIEQRLRALVSCRVDARTDQFAGGSCSAHVEVLRAPKGKLDALAKLVDDNDIFKAPHDDGWFQLVLQALSQRNQHDFEARSAEANRQNKIMSDILLQQHNQFMASQQRNHEAFMAQQRSSFESSMRNANNAMNARTTAASDWVDYALDQQTVTGSGGTTKVSSAYSQTWSNGNGQWYQTNDPNANPNGALSGTWTQQTKVHGNGQPY